MKKDTLEKLVRSLRRPQEVHERLYHLFITKQANLQNLYHGYKALAALLLAGYFSIVLTTNDDMMLEQALEEQGLSTYQSMSVGRDSDEKVAMALDGQETGICIVKFCVDGQAQLAEEVRNSLRGYLQRNIVIVGCIDGVHQDMMQALAEKNDNSLYYVVPALSDADTGLDVLRKRYKQYERFLIDGSNGEFITFFNDLGSLLLPPHFSPYPSARQSGGVSQNRHLSIQAKEALDGSAEGKHSSSFFLKDQLLPGQTRPLEAIPAGEVDSVPKSVSAEVEPEQQQRSGPLEATPEMGAEETTCPVSLVGESEGQWRNDSGPLEYQAIPTGPLEAGTLRSIQSDAIRELPWPGEVGVLIVTVTNVELKAFLSHYPGRVRRIANGKTYYDLGLVGQVRTVVVQANHMGPIIAHATVDEGIRALSPRAVIMVGIAFGVRARGQQIGDILVSKQIHDYDPERIGTGENDQRLSYSRGTRVAASEWLVDRFYAGSNDWSSPPEIHFGVILSGSKLIDNKEFQNALLRSAPDAIGGEMEGVGLSIAANRRKVDWLLVKGISDWADGTKDENQSIYQQQAAENAARLVLFVIEQEDFMHSL